MEWSEDVQGGLALKMWTEKVRAALEKTVAELRVELCRAAGLSDHMGRHEGVEHILARGVRGFCRNWISLALPPKGATEEIDSQVELFNKLLNTFVPR